MSGDLRAYVSVEMIPTKLLQQQPPPPPPPSHSIFFVVHFLFNCFLRDDLGFNEEILPASLILTHLKAPLPCTLLLYNMVSPIAGFSHSLSLSLSVCLCLCLSLFLTHTLSRFRSSKRKILALSHAVTSGTKTGLTPPCGRNQIGHRPHTI